MYLNFEFLYLFFSSFKSVENYELKISDELGNIEEDLMIESNQRVGKYGFQFLSLVESEKLFDNRKNKVQVKMFVKF